MTVDVYLPVNHLSERRLQGSGLRMCDIIPRPPPLRRWQHALIRSSDQLPPEILLGLVFAFSVPVFLVKAFEVREDDFCMASGGEIIALAETRYESRGVVLDVPGADGQSLQPGP